MMNKGNPTGKDIRFIDSHYKDLFRLPDGGSIRITFADGDSAVRKCTYIDEYHTQVGNNVFHICQFAELMERNGSTYKPEPEPEPERMVATNMGKMPIEDYREIVALQHGFDSYADMRSQGFCIGNGMDSDIEPKKESVVDKLAEVPEKAVQPVVAAHKHKEPER